MKHKKYINALCGKAAEDFYVKLGDTKKKH